MRKASLIFVVAALAALALPVGAPARKGPRVLDGISDQNQPVRLRVDRRRHLLRFRIGLLVDRCRGPGGDQSTFGAPRATTIRPHRSLRVGRAGHARTSYLIRRRYRREGGLDVINLSSRVTFRASLGRGRAASGTLRVRTSVREVNDTTEGVDRWRFVCDSGKRRWRVPRLSFSGPWRPTGPMREPRTSGVLVPLEDGEVLLAGGFRGGERLTRGSEVYSPRSNRWRRTGRLRRALSDAAGVRLSDGRVLLAGGGTDNPRLFSGVEPLREVEIYNPRRRRWDRAAPMRVEHLGPSATQLADGRVLVAGGFRRGGEAEMTPTAAVEIYDPVGGVWSGAANLPGPFGLSWSSGSRPLAARLPGNRVLVADGAADSQHGTFTVYDARTNSWSPRQPIPGFFSPEAGPGIVNGLTVLADGRVLAVGACELVNDSGPLRARVAIFGPTGWQAAARPAFCASALATLPSGRVLFAGSTAALYDPTRDRWQAAPRYRFPHPDTTGTTASPSATELAPAPRGALLIGDGLNRFSSAERFFER